MKAESRKERARSNATNILRAAIALLFLGLVVWAITLNRYDLVIADREPWLWLTVAPVSVGPELAGIVIGVVTIDYLNERRQREQLKAQFIRQMGSNIRNVAVPAARELAHHGWLFDGSLSGVDLRNANLSEANLDSANLSTAYLIFANLSLSDCQCANLSGANLSFTYLQAIDFRGANLSGADLQIADLYGARLDYADLSRAHLLAADLIQANLWQTDLSEADLSFTNLSGARNWTIDQLEQAATLEGATMPDEVQLNGELKRERYV